LCLRVLNFELAIPRLSLNLRQPYSL